MPNPLRTAARVLTGSTYALLGFDAARSPGGRVDQAGPTLDAIRSVLPLPQDDELIVRGNGAVQTVGGLLLALGQAPRLSALALLGSLLPTTMAGHAYWRLEDPAARAAQRIQFHKNLAMTGGLLFAVLDRPSRPGGRLERRGRPRAEPAAADVAGRSGGSRALRSLVPGQLTPTQPMSCRRGRSRPRHG